MLTIAPLAALDSSGVLQVAYSLAGTETFHGGAAWGDTGVAASLDAVTASDQFLGGLCYSAAGELRLYDATGGLPAGSVVVGGLAVHPDGRLCGTTDAPTSLSRFVCGVLADESGRVHCNNLGGGGGPTGDGLLLESGSYLLAENGNYLITEA